MVYTLSGIVLSLKILLFYNEGFFKSIPGAGLLKAGVAVSEVAVPTTAV